MQFCVNTFKIYKKNATNEFWHYNIIIYSMKIDIFIEICYFTLISVIKLVAFKIRWWQSQGNQNFKKGKLNIQY